MQVFEFHFNPKTKEDVIYDSFVFEPENFWERKMGRLYMVGLLSHALPQNIRFLENLSSQIKKEYYRVTDRQPELSLKESLRKANEFLAEEAKGGNVSWLGNLEFAILALKDDVINFATTGEISIFLLRAGQITDINQALRLQEIEPYPLKIFGNIVLGKLIFGDRIIVLTKEIADFFSSQNILKEIAKFEEIEEKKLKKIFQNKEQLYSKIPGICFLVDLTEKELAKGKVTFEKKILAVPFWQSLRQLPKQSIKKLLPATKPKLKLKAPQGLKLPSIKLPGLNLPTLNLTIRLPSIGISQVLKNNLLLISFLILIMVLGGFFANLERKKEMEKAQNTLAAVENNIQAAQEALILKNEKETNRLYKEAWNKIFPLTKFDSPVRDEASQIKTFIESQLIPLNQLKVLDNPEMIFDFKDYNFLPQRMVGFKENIYFFNPLAADIYRLKPAEKGGDFLRFEEKINLGAVLEQKGKVLFFSRPDKLFSFKGSQFDQAFVLKDPYPDFQFNDFSTFETNLYFLDSDRGKILKYIYNENSAELQPNPWLKEERSVNGRSLTVDGSVWILSKDNSLERFFGGKSQEILKLDFFPYPKSLSKIFSAPNLPYLYFLEPIQNRIVILDKFGEVIRQFQSEQFDNLKDFSVSEDGRTIYLLNGIKVYKVSF